MTAREKFEARLKELGLENVYRIDDHVGATLPDKSLVVLVHIGGEKGDPYTEMHYPPFDELWKNEKFRQACKEEYYNNSDDDEFVADLARWLDIHKPWNECPLFPVDLYWLTDRDGKGFESSWFNYSDDATAEEVIKNLVAEYSLA